MGTSASTVSSSSSSSSSTDLGFVPVNKLPNRNDLSIPPSLLNSSYTTQSATPSPTLSTGT